MNLGNEHDKLVLSWILILQKFWEELILDINIECLFAKCKHVKCAY